MKITELRKLLDEAESKGFSEILMYNDGYYEDCYLTVKKVAKIGTESINTYGKPVDEACVKQQYDLYYKGKLTFEQYLDEAIKLRAKQKEEWFDGVDTAVLIPYS